MSDSLRVRVYNVRFGDAILVTVPDWDGDRTTRRHLLIDVGNVLNKEGGDDAVFQPVVADILKTLDGAPLDLYVMTHEHLDHVQGLFYAAEKLYPPGELKARLNTQYAWLTASADPDYYSTHPEADRRKRLYQEAYEHIALYLNSASPQASANGAFEPFRAFLANNNPKNTEQCVDFLRNLAPTANTYYVHRETDTAGKHPFKDASFEIWAPEEDSSAYYRKSLLPLALADSSAIAAPLQGKQPPEPPAGVDAGAFYDLLAMREGGISDSLLSIDKAANNTSVVFTLKWRDWVLLFAGDAELGSWRMMDKAEVLKPVDFLKVSHHGSHNGTPEESILEKFLPKASGGKKTAVISTWDETYSGIPHNPTNAKLKSRAKLSSTLDNRNRLYRDFNFRG